MAAAPPSTSAPTTAPEASPEPSEQPSPAASSTASDEPTEASDDSFVLTAVVDRVEVHESPGGPVQHELDNPRDTGAPLTFLLADDPGRGWYEVMVPVRPNGTTGFVRAQDVDIARVPYRLVMSTADNELTVYEGDEVLRTMPAASGTGDTPTPLGLFYLTELLEPTNAGYGPYAYGLSGFSEVLDSFGGGPGQIGLHGTDDADSVGQAVSHGCIRLSDEDITYLAELLPLGTPVQIL
ncbi:L,D-transpeptidase family protein [Jannaschia sp. R86511]|uniref:L,D-transpeptidase n=1 Tax=Jannaschia sp. R86511 TaxID=3093853 RepID=UPI0036D43771